MAVPPPPELVPLLSITVLVVSSPLTGSHNESLTALDLVSSKSHIQSGDAGRFV